MPAYPMKNSIAGIARRCGLSPSHASPDTPRGRKLARILSRRNAAAAK